MKVKCFAEFSQDELAESINNFISNKRIIDIKYQLETFETGSIYNALVMYEDKENNDED